MGFIQIAPEILSMTSYYYDTEMQVFITLHEDGNYSHGYEWKFNIASKQRVLDDLTEIGGIILKSANPNRYEKLKAEIDKWINDVHDMPVVTRAYSRSPRRHAHNENAGREERDYPSEGFGAHSFVDYITYIRFE